MDPWFRPGVFCWAKGGVGGVGGALFQSRVCPLRTWKQGHPPNPRNLPQSGGWANRPTLLLGGFGLFAGILQTVDGFKQDGFNVDGC